MTVLTTISAVFKLGKTKYEYEIPLNRRELGLESRGWVWESLQHEARRSKLHQCQKSEVTGVLTVMNAAANSEPSWQVLANTPVARLSLHEITQTFGLIETVINAKETWGANTKANHSMRTRALLGRYLVSIRYPKAERLSLVYKPKLNGDRIRHSRKLISDSVIEQEGESAAPIGALPHRNSRELHEKTLKTLEAPIEQIQKACEATFQTWIAAEELLAEMDCAPVDTTLLKMVWRSLTRPAEPRWIKGVAVEELASIYAHVFRVLRASDPKVWARAIPHRTRELNSLMKDLTGLANAKGFSAYHYPLNLTQPQIVACLLAIQCHTAWNVNVVLSLTQDGISSLTPPFELQSFKERINKPSTMVVVEEKDVLVVQAIKFLVRRLDLMKELGWIKQKESRLWLNASSVRSGKLEEYVTWGQALREFQNEHKLPHFSAEQVRVQVLCLRGEAGGLEEMRRLANHNSISTTAIYASQLVLFRKNESINLEFQRRIERQVIYAETAHEGYLWPIGDGTSCSDPEKPPLDEYLERGICGAKQCSFGDGCPNRRIVVNTQRIEEAVRTFAYYRANWNRLLNENHAAFETYHFPSMLFNRALVEVLRQGRFGFLVKETERLLEVE